MMLRTAIALLISCVAALAVNLLPNSSFEIGAGRGWMHIGAGNSGDPFYGRSRALEAEITNDASHGQYSMFAPRTYSRAMWLTNGEVTITFSARVTSGTDTLDWGMLNGSELYGDNEDWQDGLTTTWTRFTNVFTVDSNALYWLKFYPSPTKQVQIDEIQVEPGDTATAYAPMYQVECGISIDATNRVWFEGDTPTFRLNFFNAGAESNVTVIYDVYDAFNSNVLSGSLVHACPANTNDSVTVNLPDRYGWFRIVTRLAEFSDSMDEGTTAIYPFAADLTWDADAWLGGHPNASPYHVNREMRVGRKWARLLSPASGATRWSTVEPSEGSFTFKDYCMTGPNNAGMNIIAPLTPGDSGFPSWTSGFTEEQLLTAWSNYCWVVVNRYTDVVPCTNIWWEVGPNEPLQTALLEATNYTKYLEIGITAVTNANPAAKIIAIAGASGNGAWAQEAWTNLSASAQAAVTAVSTHQYPQDNNSVDFDPNGSFFEWTASTRAYPWVQIFRDEYGLEVWNTESGTYRWPAHMRGLNVLWRNMYNLHSSPTVEASRSDAFNRQLTATTRILSQALRDIGYGFTRFIYYDSRWWNSAVHATDTLPYAGDYMDVDSPEVVSLSIAQYMVQTGFGKITNDNSDTSTLALYSFTNRSGDAVIAGWLANRQYRTLTCTNGEFAVYDSFGNLIQTNETEVTLGRLPRYLVSSTLTLEDMTNIVKFASVASPGDTLAPNISIDIAPSGEWAEDGRLRLVKFTALDERNTATANADTATNVVYSAWIDSTALLANSQSNHLWLPTLSEGNHKLTVAAMDASGNSSTNVYYFTGEASGLPGAPYTHRVGTIRAGTLRIGP
jgi:hypothetical protein